MKYVSVPKEVSFDDLWEKGALSPSLFERITCPNPNVRKVAMLVEEPIKGKEVGSKSYVEKSQYYFIRNRALQEIAFLLQTDPESIVPIKPKSFMNYDLTKGDILYSKDSNIGECCIIESDTYKKHTISSGILKLVAKKNPLYLFAFLKHVFVKAQLHCMTPKGSTIRHSGLNVLSCVIPFPRGSNTDRIIDHIERLVETVINIEMCIKQKTKIIYDIITEELTTRQKPETRFTFELPRIKEIEKTGRMDAGTYSKQFKEKMFLVTNYADGYRQLTSPELGFSIRPGPSLEFKIIKTRIDSDEPRNGFYALIIPTDISEYGTLERLRYMGTARSIETLQFGDILIGESGTWRSIVLLSNYPRCITNAHGIRLRHKDGNLVLSIFVRCMLAWYKRMGVFDLMAVGGSGGHLSPIYFDKILIPTFPEQIQKRISELYYEMNGHSGIAQLNEQRLSLLGDLNRILDNIMDDKSSEIESMIDWV